LNFGFACKKSLSPVTIIYENGQDEKGHYLKFKQETLKMGKTALRTIALLFLASTLQAQEATQRFEKVVNRMVEAINDANWPGVQADFGQVMLDAFPLEKLTPFSRG